MMKSKRKGDEAMSEVAPDFAVLEAGQDYGSSDRGGRCSDLVVWFESGLRRDLHP